MWTVEAVQNTTTMNEIYGVLYTTQSCHSHKAGLCPLSIHCSFFCTTATWLCNFWHDLWPFYLLNFTCLLSTNLINSGALFLVVSRRVILVVSLNLSSMPLQAWKYGSWTKIVPITSNVLWWNMLSKNIFLDFLGYSAAQVFPLFGQCEESWFGAEATPGGCRPNRASISSINA